jgi:hypothetical protein
VKRASGNVKLHGWVMSGVACRRAHMYEAIGGQSDSRFKDLFLFL